MKLEIGGGVKPLGGEWVNLDLIAAADIKHDLNVTPWPLDNDSVDAVYSSHCIEHVDNPYVFLNEVARICVIGAPVEIRCPAVASDMAHLHHHRHTFSPIAAVNADRFFPLEFWTGQKRLKLASYRYEPSILLQQFRDECREFRRWDDQKVMHWFPRTAHETRFYYVCEAWQP